MASFPDSEIKYKVQCRVCNASLGATTEEALDRVKKEHMRFHTVEIVFMTERIDKFVTYMHDLFTHS